MFSNTHIFKAKKDSIFLRNIPDQKNITLKKAVEAGRSFVKRTIASFKPQVVYVDYDTICMRASNGKDITFELHPYIDIDRFVARFDLKKYQKYYGTSEHQSLLLVILWYPLSEKVSAPNFEISNSGVTDECLTLYEWARRFGISKFEMKIICEVATHEFLIGFAERRSMRVNATSKPSRLKVRSPCA